MSNAKVGNYDVTMEQRGLRLSKQNDPHVRVRPMLAFSFSPRGKAPIFFTLTRLHTAPDGLVTLQGQTTERVVLDAKILPSAPEFDGIQIELRVENATEEMECRVGVQLILAGETSARWMVPGFFYGDNRVEGTNRVYPGFSMINFEPRRLISNFWALRADRATLPVACCWTAGAFAWLSTEEIFGRSRDIPDGLGMAGLQFGAEDGQPRLAAEFPYREAPAKFSFCHDDKTEPEEVPILLPEATPLHATVLFGLAKPDLHAYSNVLRHLTARLAPAHPLRSRTPPEVAEVSAHAGLLRWHYDGRTGAIYETTAFDHSSTRKRGPNEPATMHAGGLGGLMPAYTLLLAGRESNHPESITAGTATINKFCAQLSPAGTLFPVWTEESGWACSFGPEDGTAHSRTIAEAVYFLLRAIALELKHNSNHPQWHEAALSSLSYALGSQREDGALPSYFDLAIGRATSYEGVAGMAWIAPFAIACKLLQKGHFREVALRAGEYYAQFVRKEFLNGTIEDQHLVPSSDDAHWGLISYLALYELDRDVKWLDLAQRCADLALTWRFSYNSTFSPDSILSVYDFRTRGGDVVSAATPYLGCGGLLSYRELLRLSAFTGDTYYRDRAEDSRIFATQLVAREDGHFNARAGMVLGQVAHTDFLLPKGMIMALSNSMAATYIKYAELMRRQLAPIMTNPLALQGGVDEELRRIAPVLYQETVAAHDEDEGPSLFSSGGFAGILGLANQRAAAPPPPPRPTGGSQASRSSRASNEGVPLLGAGLLANLEDEPTGVPPGRRTQPLEPNPFEGGVLRGVAPPTPIISTPRNSGSGVHQLPRSTPRQTPPADPPISAPFNLATPLPFQGLPIAPETPITGPDGRPSSDEVEIKYKIF